MLDNSNTKFIFLALNVSNNFATVDYDAHINTKTDYTVNHDFRSMTIQKLNTRHTVCELERNQLLTIMSIKDPQLASYTLKAQLSGFSIVHPFFLLYTKLTDALIVYLYILNDLMYVDPITRQTYVYATPIACDNNPRNIFELDHDSDDQDFYILGPEPIKRKPLLMFTPSQVKTTIRPNNSTSQDAGIYSNAELDQSWNRILVSKHFDFTLQLLGKTLRYFFISSNTPDFDTN